MDNIRTHFRVLKTDTPDSDAVRLEALSYLKSQIISHDAAAVFTEEDIQTLCHYAFQEQKTFSVIAQKCVANLLLLDAEKRQIFVDNKYPAEAARRLKGGFEEQLLCSRILFLLTYETKFDFEDLYAKENLANNMHEAIASHASNYVDYRQNLDELDETFTKESLPILEPGALTEILKLLFNLNQFYPRHVDDFSRSILPILQILSSIQLQDKSLQSPVTQLVNVLLSLNLPGPKLTDSPIATDYTPLFPGNAADATYPKLISILEKEISSSKEEDLDNLVPLVTLLRRVFELAPHDVRWGMQAQLLPSSEERDQPLGKTESLPSRLLRLSTAPTVPRLKEGISSLLFELSDKDAATFVRNVGYGFAAGYLLIHNLPVPDQSSGDLGETVTTVDGQEINPVTGQRRDMEPKAPLPEMTDKEKEREAEKLFVLFERLKATGVMNVVNPVEQAVHEGRFEEID